MADIDNFKAINDTWGHAVGDDVIKAMVEASRAVLRTTDLFGRLGGEEFGIILPDVDREAARVLSPSGSARPWPGSRSAAVKPPSGLP